MGDRVLRAGQNLNLHINMTSQTKKKEKRKKLLRDPNYMNKTPRSNLMWI
jgi:hypothetical protein